MIVWTNKTVGVHTVEIMDSLVHLHEPEKSYVTKRKERFRDNVLNLKVVGFRPKPGTSKKTKDSNFNSCSHN